MGLSEKEFEKSDVFVMANGFDSTPPKVGWYRDDTITERKSPMIYASADTPNVMERSMSISYVEYPDGMLERGLALDADGATSVCVDLAAVAVEANEQMGVERKTKAQELTFDARLSRVKDGKTYSLDVTVTWDFDEQTCRISPDPFPDETINRFAIDATGRGTGRPPQESRSR